MSKIAGVKNKSPETYPQSFGTPTVLETLRGVNAGPAALSSSFATILAAPVMFTPSVAGAKAIVMVSGVIESVSEPTEVTVEILNVPDEVYEIVFGANTGRPPIPFSLSYEIPDLGAVAPQTIDVQAKTNTGGATAEVTSVSIVVMVTSA